MNVRTFKYLSPLLLYTSAWIAFSRTGIFTWMPMFYSWLVIPIAELCIKPDPKNMAAAEEELAKSDRTYDYMLYIIVIMQFLLLGKFFMAMKDTQLHWWEIYGRIWVMGLLCGTFGINVAHELGHRSNSFERFLSRSLLLTSLYMHFYIEHNKGHHKNVGTPKDPASARYNEPIYLFYFRTIIFSYLSAWRIANHEMRKNGLPIWHWRNEMLQAHVIQIAFVVGIFFAFGWLITLYFLASASIGIMLLETVNYIEHYGLQRKETSPGNYERAMPKHSWNSNHVLGRVMLFELSRHSDHHYLASRKYQVLRHHDDAPQLPTGYPGSMILALVPPAWFYVMNKKIKEMNSVD